MQNLVASQLQPPARGNGEHSPSRVIRKVVGRIWQLLLALIDVPFRFVFGRDLFISYSRKDSRKYAPNLALALQQRRPNLSFYLDRWIAPPSGKLPLSLKLQLRWSSIMVVVCTENAIGSDFVRDEVARFASLGRKVLTVDVDGAFNTVRAQEPWVGVSGADPEEESGAAVLSGEPSENVVERILKMVEFTTQDRRLRRAVWGTLAFVLLSVGGTAAFSFFTVRAAKAEASAAEQRATQADQNALTAEGKATTAEGRAVDAVKRENDAKEAQGIAERKAVDAASQAEAAERLRASAEAKTVEALEKERNARAEAQKQEGIALARRLAAENNLAADPQSEEFEKKVLLTVESMRRFPSREAYSNLVEGIRMMPRQHERAVSHQDAVNQLTFSHDGKYMATLAGGVLGLHKADALATGGEIGESQPMSPVGEKIMRVAFSPDGTYMAAARKGGVRLWLAKEMRELAPIAGSPLALFGGGSSLIAVLDNKRAAARGDHSDVVQVWRPEGDGAREVASAAVGGDVSEVTFSGDSKHFTTRSTKDDNIRLDFWNTTGRLQTKPVAETIPLSEESKAGFSPNAKYLWFEGDTANGSTRTLLKADTRQTVLDDLRSIDFSPDGRFLVTTQFDPEYGELNETIVWDASGDSLKKLHSLGVTRVHQGSAGTFSPDGLRFAQLIKENRIKVWNTLSGQVVAYVKMEGNYRDVAFTYEGRFMAVANGKNVTLWPVGREWKSSEFIRLFRPKLKPDALWIDLDRMRALSPDGKLMALAGGTDVTILDAKNGQEFPLIKTPCHIEGIRFGATSERVVTHGSCGVWAWQTRGSEQPERLGDLPGKFKWITFSRDGKYAAVAGPAGPMVIELSKPSNVVQLSNDETARSKDDDEFGGDPRVTVAFSNDGDRVAVASRNRIHVWEWRTRRLLHAIENKVRGSEDYNLVVGVAFDEDDHDTIITADMYEALVWNLRDSPRVVGRLELQETSRNTNFATTLSPNGKFVATKVNVSTAEGLQSKTTVWQLRPQDVWKNACSRLESGSLSEPDWKREFGDRPYGATCAGLSRSTPGIRQ